MPFIFKSNDRITVLGQTGTGKSNFVKYLFFSFEKVIVYDYMHEWDERFGTIVRSLPALDSALSKGHAKVILQTPIAYTDEKDLNELFDYIFYNHYNCMIICEEIDAYAKTHKLPQGFSNVLRLGRKKGQGLIMVSRRIAEINLSCLANSQWIISFMQFMDQDLKRLASVMGNTIWELPKLDPYWFVIYDVKAHQAQICEPIKLMPNVLEGR